MSAKTICSFDLMLIDNIERSQGGLDRIGLPWRFLLVGQKPRVNPDLWPKPCARCLTASSSHHVETVSAVTAAKTS